jgi:hypothetical protein
MAIVSGIAVELQARAEQRDDDGELGRLLVDRSVGQRIEPPDPEHLKCDRRSQPEAEIDQAGRERPVVLV